MIRAPGFDTTSLDQVVPEYVADTGTKKGEKVDFALKINGKIAMLIEVKSVENNLGETQYNQLYRYFSTTDARVAILTNGREARFFSDTGAPNLLDKRPFFVFDLQNADEAQIEELRKFHRDAFDANMIPDTAATLKFQHDTARFLKQQIENPEEAFVRFLIKTIHDGSATRSTVEQFRPAIKTALDQIVRDRIQEKLDVSFAEKAPGPIEAPCEDIPDEENDIVTTEEEMEAFRIVRAIAAQIVDVNRIVMRDAKSYCAILADNNNRKPICRFYFNSPRSKKIGLFDADRNETKFDVESPVCLYQLQDALLAAVRTRCEVS